MFRTEPKDPKERAPSEWRLQAEIISEFHRLEDTGLPFTCAGDQNAAKRGKVAAGIAKVTGMTAGEPDMRIYYRPGRIKLVELKKKGGVASKKQEARHERLADLGHDVMLLEVHTLEAARAEANKIIYDLLGITA